jgi:phosphoglycolate phosphatase-like HAD superfamily hydrolase
VFDLLIFDLDGTLIDSRLDLANAVNATRQHMGMAALDNERVYSYVGNGAAVLIHRALGDQATEAEVEEALEYFLDSSIFSSTTASTISISPPSIPACANPSTVWPRPGSAWLSSPTSRCA